MFLYKLTFNNGKKCHIKSENLTLAQARIVDYMEKNGLTECLIICPNEVVRRVQKTGAWHWVHNGYSFD